MVTVTQISAQEKRKNRYNIFIDNEYYSSVSLETVIKHGLKVGLIVDKSELSEIIFDDNKTTALSCAIAYLSKRLKTKREVKDYLVKKGYDDAVVKYCIEKLCEYRYIDDEEYAKRYIESTSKVQGRRLSEYKLMMKGVRKQDIGAAYDQAEIDEFDNAVLVAKKHIKNKELTKENIAKTYRYLIGRGFSYEQASHAVGELNDED